MANPPIGLSFIEGSLGVVKLTFNNIALGKSLGACEIEKVEDYVEIKHDQDGTQPFDFICTGEAWKVTVPLSEITIANLKSVMRGITEASGGSYKFGKDMLISCRDNFAKKLVLTRVESDGSESTDPMFRLNFYKAFPRLTGTIGFTVDAQRVMNVEFYIFEDITNNAFGYVGYNSSLGIGAA